MLPLSYLLPWKGKNVPSKRKKSGSKTPGEAWRDKIHFLNFSRKDEAEIAQWLETNNHGGMDALEEVITDLWSVKITPRIDGEGYTLTVSPKDENHPTANHSYISNWPSVGLCCLVALWLVRVYLDDERATDDSATDELSPLDKFR